MQAPAGCRGRIHQQRSGWPSTTRRLQSRAAVKVRSQPAAEDLLLADIRVVLVAPKTAANIGAVARACGNFEAPQLCIVAPRCNVQSEEVAWVACGSYVTDRMQVVSSLEEALADCVGSVGFSRRSGVNRYVYACLGDLLRTFPGAVPGMLPPPSRPGPSPLPAAPAAAPPGRTVALVFGREESGLTHEELRTVTHVCAIPSGRIQPSLNLSHAVAVVLSECFNRRAFGGQSQLASSSQQAAADSSAPPPERGSSSDASTSAPEPEPDAVPSAFWLDSTSQPVGKYGAKDRHLQFAVASQVEPLLKKVSWIGEACGMSSEGSKTNGWKRQPLGHIRALLGRARVTTSEVNSIHGFASAVIETLQPGHPLGKRRQGGEQQEGGSGGEGDSKA